MSSLFDINAVIGINQIALIICYQQTNEIKGNIKTTDPCNSQNKTFLRNIDIPYTFLHYYI